MFLILFRRIRLLLLVIYFFIGWSMYFIEGGQIALWIPICKYFFNKPRKGRGGHSYIFKTGFRGDPILNLQPNPQNHKMAKPFQVDDVRKAIEKLKEEGRI